MHRLLSFVFNVLDVDLDLSDVVLDLDIEVGYLVCLRSKQRRVFLHYNTNILLWGWWETYMR